MAPPPAGSPSAGAPADRVLAGRYRLGELLGQGGMADVHRAVDEQTGSAVAVKILRSPDPGAARRLAQEAKALEQLRHPGLVRLLDAGVMDGRAFLVMELVDGDTLGQLVRRGPLGSGRVAAIGASVAGALAYVHAQGIVHRDVKPGNILVGGDGRARLADFGIASLADASVMTATGTTLGTVAYMAPEQIEHHQVGPTADIWSLAMVLLECLIGRRVYEGRPVEVVARRLAGPVPLPADLPGPWRALLASMFDHDPMRRPTAAEVTATVAEPEFQVPWAPAETVPMTAAGHPGSLAAGLAGAAGAAGAGAMLVAGHDLAALRGVDPHGAPGAAATIADQDRTLAAPSRGLGPAAAPTASGQPGASPGGSRRTRPLALAAAAVAAVAVIVVAAFLLGSGTPTRRSGSRAPTARSSSLAPTSTTTTTVPPTPTSASGALLAAVGNAVTTGALSAADAASLGKDVSAALIDVAGGKTAAAVSQLDAADTLLSGVSSNGSLPAADAAVLQADLATLASTLGLPAPTVTPPTTTTTTTVPVPPGPPGPGKGGPGKGGKGGH